MRIAVTGASGFIGRAVVARLARGAAGSAPRLTLLDRHPTPGVAGEWLLGSLAEPETRAALLGGGVDVLFHLASVPGGAAQSGFEAARAVNLDATLALFDETAAASARPPVIVYASSIAALGLVGPDRVTARSRLEPRTSYGTHKAMAELYLADLTRRGAVDGRSVRPAGIVARPRDAYAGFATAWLSELFRASFESRPFVAPARASARVWLQSVGTVADAIVHAATLPADRLGEPTRAWTLPATVARLDELAAALRRRAPGASITFGDGGMDQPPLDAADALALGFPTDGDAAALVDAVFAQLDAERLAGAG